ncbi:MAG: hydrogenase maturation nickel metallochaperone HypA [Planctomycetota bacterium]|jgi:hydrogenase nickel incorporation protein HypA/HybF
MHELSIAHNLIELASETAAANGADRVVSLQVRVGDLSGVVVEALEFAFEVAREDTPCRNATLVIERVPATVRCPACHAPKTLERLHCFRCPDCDSLAPELLSGRELDLVSIEVNEHEAAHP